MLIIETLISTYWNFRYNIPTTEPAPVSEAAANDIPQSLASVVKACLSKNPDHRPATIDELAAALRNVPVESPWNQDRAARWWEQNTL